MKLLPVILVCGLAAFFALRPAMNKGSRVSAGEAKALIDNGDCLLLDVREPDEYAGGHIPGAVNLPLERIKAGETLLPPDKDGLILVYCLTGRRAGRAVKALTALGYTRAKNMGGVMNWPYDVEKS